VICTSSHPARADDVLAQTLIIIEGTDTDQMRDQRLAREVQTKRSHGSVLGNVGHRSRRIHECNITYSELRDPIVLNHRRSAAKLKYRVVMFHTVGDRIKAGVSCHKPINGSASGVWRNLGYLSRNNDSSVL
jgi:hypothetical protein